MRQPNVYIDLDGGQWADFCNVGRRVVRGLNTAGMRGYTSMSCTCGAELSLRNATQKESEAFWNEMSSMADAAAAESRW